MGRLFWKVFAGFWLAMALAAGVAALAVYSASVEDETTFDGEGGHAVALYANRWVGEYLARYGAVLTHGGPVALRNILQESAERQRSDDKDRFRPTMLVVNAQGEDILGRPVPADSLRQAHRRIARLSSHQDDDDKHHAVAMRRQARGVEYVQTPEAGAWWLFMPRTEATERRRPPRPWWRELSPINAGLLALSFSFLFSGALAWYLARPIRALRDGFRAVASGRLDTRVAAKIGPRRDELADLGADFDKTTARLESLINAQKQLLHDVSHELRSPLARLQAATGLLEQSPERAPALITRIEQETSRLDALVGEILTLSRLDEQRDTRPDTPFDLNDLLADLVQDAQFEAQAGNKFVTLSDIDGDVTGDPVLIQRACENLVRNAIRYSPEGQTVAISVSAEPVTGPGKSGREICISVADHGPGLAEHELQAVIEPFKRGSETSQDGFGLGLAIARRAIEIHGGALQLQNRTDGSGLVATLRWPD